MRIAIVVLGALVSVGCTAAARSRVEQSVASALVSDQQEAQLGLQVRQQLEQQGVRYVTDPAVNDYVMRVATPILQAANRDRRGVDWKLSVIDDPKTVNAFATPGGYVYVYTGLILSADNESELAGVLGHEAAHVTARHSARQLVNAYGLEAITSLALGKNPHLLAQLGAAIAANGAMLAHSRADESEADALGVGYTRTAGYDAMGLATFFQKLEQQQGRAPAFLTWLSTHPPPGDRVREVQSLIQTRGLQGGKLDSPEFQQIKQRLRR